MSLLACGDSESADSTTFAAFGTDGIPSPAAALCDDDDGGVILPDGFCALVVANVDGARHLAVAENGDVFVAREDRDRPPVAGGLTVLRDGDGDGRLETRVDWPITGGNDVLLAGEFVYYAPNDAVLRYRLPAGSMHPQGTPDTIVSGLPASSNHRAKSIALGPEGSLFVSIGGPGNACEERGSPGSRGLDPCPHLRTRGGIWRFESDKVGQRASDGQRFATGLRNVVALATHPLGHALYGVMHGRDQLYGLWPSLYTPERSAETPAEELVEITPGSNFGWPYCYFDGIDVGSLKSDGKRL